MVYRRVFTLLSVLTLITSLSLCSVADAQGRGRGRGGPGGAFGGFGFGGGPVELALRDDVQAELNLTEQQVRDVRDLAQESRQGQRGFGGFEGFQDLSQEERAEAIAKMREEREAQTKELRGKLREILNSKQGERFAELDFQFSLQRGDLQGALAAVGVVLSEDDADKLRETQQEAQEKIQEQIAKIRREANVNALSSVMAASKIETLMGAPFTFEADGPGQGFGGGRGARGGGRGDRAGGGGGRRGQDRNASPDTNDDGDDKPQSGRNRRRDA
jgi:hypothetical protein